MQWPKWKRNWLGVFQVQLRVTGSVKYSQAAVRTAAPNESLSDIQKLFLLFSVGIRTFSCVHWAVLNAHKRFYAERFRSRFTLFSL